MPSSDRSPDQNNRPRAWERLVPILGWLPHYRAEWLARDLVAGLTVWAVMVPTALAYAGIAGVPPVVGLYTVPLALVAYSFLGTSRTLVVGPDSATALLSAHTIAVVVAQGSSEYLALTSALALLVGITFIGLGALRMGWVTNFLSQPVVKGFVQGLALVTMMTQLPKLFGVGAVHGEFFQRLWALIQELPQTHAPTLALSLASLGLLYLLPRILPRIPAAFTTVAISIVVVSVFDLDQQGVAVVGAVKAGLPDFKVPAVGLADLKAILHGALAIALLGFSESLAAAKAAAEKTGGEIDSNQELIGLGVANLGSGASSGFVVAGSLSQSAVSMVAGGRTQLSALFHAGFIVLTLLYLMPLFEKLPHAVLGAIVVKAMLGMLDFRPLWKYWRIGGSDAAQAIVAFLGELVLGVLPGVALAVAVSILHLIHRASHPGTAILGKLPDLGSYRNLARHPEAEVFPGLLIFRFHAALFFSNARYFADQLKEFISKTAPPVREVLVDAESIGFMDATALDMLASLKEELAGRGIALAFAGLSDTIRDRMRRADLEIEIGCDHFHETLDAGVRDFRKRHPTP